MSLSASDLFLDRSAVPAADMVERKVAEHGHVLTFPPRFAMSDVARSGWINVKLDGARTGFDYTILSREAFLGADPEGAAFPDQGDTVIAFAGRGDQTSILAMTLVQRAICELTDAHGWWQEGEQRLSNAEMIEFCKGTIAAIRSSPAPVVRARPPASSAEKRLAIKALIIFAAVLAGIYALSALAGYIFAPRTAH